MPTTPIARPPEDSPADAALTELVRRQMPFAEVLGLEAVCGDAEEVVLRGTWAARWCTTGSTLHGGFLMALADAAGAVCAVLNMPAGSSTTTIGSTTNLMRGVRGGPVTASARPVHVGATMVVVQTDVTRDDHRLVARTIQTQLVLPGRGTEGDR